MTSHFVTAAMVVLLALGIGAEPTAATAQDAPLKIAVEGKYPPFNYMDPNGDLQGFDLEIARALCTQMQVKCEFVVQEWTAMIPGLLEKRYDAIASSMSMSAERREKVAFTSRYYDSPSSFITPKSAGLDAFAPADLAGKTLGITLATAQEAYARKLYPDLAMTAFVSSPELYQALADGKVDLILEDKLAAYDWLANTKAGQCCEFRGEDIRDVTYFGEGAGIALRKEDESLLKAFNAALAAIAEDGTYDMINAKYFPFSIK